MQQGGENTTIHARGSFGQKVIRFYGETHSGIGKRKQSDIEGEIAFMMYCHENAIPVPKIYSSKSNNYYERLYKNSSWYIVLEYIEGRSAGSFSPHMVSQIAKTMAKMHLLAEDFRFTSPRAWPGTSLELAELRSEKFLKLPCENSDSMYIFVKNQVINLRQSVASFGLSNLPTGVIHGDIMWSNMKFDGEELRAIFDFDDCRESFFIEDIAKTILYPFHLSERCIFGADGSNVDIFLKSYETIRILTDQEKAALPLLFLARIVYDTTNYYLKISSGGATPRHELQEYIKRYYLNQKFFAFDTEIR